MFIRNKIESTLFSMSFQYNLLSNDKIDSILRNDNNLESLTNAIKTINNLLVLYPKLEDLYHYDFTITNESDDYKVYLYSFRL